jgi:hypothetical protein
MADKGGKFIPITSTNSLSIDQTLWKELGISKTYFKEQMALTNALLEMGAYLCNTCTQWLTGHFPRMGEHIAISESSGTVFANSVLGARTNREGGPSSLAGALTGRVPEYGYHLDRNRYGELKISVTAKLRDFHDYGTLGYFTGKIAEDKIPVFTGIPPSISWDELKMLGAAVATPGSVAMYHIVGVTPEAPTEEAAFRLKKPGSWQVFEFGERELRETEESLSQATTKEVDMVMLGCPHVSISEIRDITELLSGRKVNSGVELLIFTSRMVKNYAERMGYASAIKASGAKMVAELCAATPPLGLFKGRDVKTVATNSAKLPYYIAGPYGLLSYYGSTKRCIEAAISGVWR